MNLEVKNNKEQYTYSGIYLNNSGLFILKIIFPNVEEFYVGMKFNIKTFYVRYTIFR